MLGQTFDLIDLPRLAALAFIEILLSADNAIVIGVLSHALPPALRKKALYIGVGSAFFLRALALFAVSYILDSSLLEFLGAVYMIYLSIRHFLKKKKKSPPISSSSFWKTVLLIECFDLAFAFDSIISGIAFVATPEIKIHGYFHPKLWLVYAGGMIGLLAIRFVADQFSRIIDLFPRIEDTAYLLVAWIGIRLALEALFHLHGFEPYFWIGFVLLFASGFRNKQKVL